MNKTHVFPPQLDHDYPVVDNRIQTRSLEAHVVDHCNLTCAHCCSLSPHHRPFYLDPSKLEHDLELASRVLRPRVFKLVGGEPLLHPSLLDLIRIVKRSSISKSISITTNGLLLERTSDAIWSEIDAMTISLYPHPRLAPSAIAAIEARARQFDVKLNWKDQTHFVVMTREVRSDDTEATAAIFSKCWLRERCHMLRDGRFYTCTRPPHFQTYFNGKEDFRADGVALDDETKLLERLLSYLHRERPLEACAHCYGGDATMVPHRLLSRTELLRRHP
jgi:GTP 3',8-cyclase